MEVRMMVRHARLRTSEMKDTGNLLMKCGFGSEFRIARTGGNNGAGC
jgi:hypothetical protein